MTILENRRRRIAQNARSITPRHIILSVVALLLFSGVLRAQTLDYGTFSGYGIGMGILGNDYMTPLAACITGTQSTLDASIAGFRASIVYNADEYKSAFHIDQQAQASFLGIAGGSDEMHFGRETGTSGSAFDIIIEAYGEHPGKTIDNVKWDDRYQAMLDSGDPVKKQQVRLDCGDRYIKTVFYETRLFAVLHVSSQQNSALTQFSGKASGNVSLDIASASASLGGDINVSSAHKAGAITIDIYSEGLGGIIPTAGALSIASADGLQDIANKLAAYLATLKDTGQPVKYRLAPLPGSRPGDLSDSRIFDYLNDLKLKYAAANYRLENVHALLIPNDPRRIIFKQPSADTALGHQEVKLAAYLDTVAEAHDLCRKTSSLNDCSTTAQMTQMLPVAGVELQPIAAPWVLGFVFAIDGVPVPAGQYTQLFAVPGKTLLEAARTLKPDAANVDVLAPVLNGEYLSSISLPVRVNVIQPPPRPPLLVGSRILRAQDLTLPAYWKGPLTVQFLVPPSFPKPNPYLSFTSDLGNPHVLHILHADLKNSCKMVTGGSLAYWDDTCFTVVGRALRDTVLTNVASNANNVPLITYFSVTSPWEITDCFGNTTSEGMAGVIFFPAFEPIYDWFAFTTGASTQVSAKVGLSIPMSSGSISPLSFKPPLLLPIFGEDESHDRPTWAQLAQSRLSTVISANSSVATGPNSCAPRVP